MNVVKHDDHRQLKFSAIEIGHTTLGWGIKTVRYQFDEKKYV